MVDHSDRQTSIYPSYKAKNELPHRFLVKDEIVTNKPEILEALKEFVKNAVEHFDKYNISKLKSELLGHHLVNFQSVLYELGETALDGKICTHIKTISAPSMEPLPVELTRGRKQIKIDINDKIKHEHRSFPQLNFLEHAFDDYFKKMKKKPLDSLFKDALAFTTGMLP